MTALMRFGIIGLSFILSSCHWFFPSNPLSSPKEEACELPLKVYPVHSVTFHQDEGFYELFLMETPMCFKNPLILENLRLGKKEEAEAKKKEAHLDYIDETHSTLYLSQDFPMKVEAQTVNPKTGNTESVSSFWTPFIAGAVGAAAGSALASRFSSGPQYVTPPAPSSTSSLLQGIDETKVSSTPKSLGTKGAKFYKKTSSSKKKKYSNSFGSSFKKKKRSMKSSSSKRRRRR